MGYIEKRGKNSWRIVSYLETSDGKQPVKMTLRMDPSLSESVQRRDAERELANLEKRLQAKSATAWTVRAWADAWLQKYVAPDGSAVTVANYRYLLDSRILPILGDYLLTDLTPAILTDWLLHVRSDSRKTTRKPDAQLSRDRRPKEQKQLISAAKKKKPLSAKTVKNYYGCLSAMLTEALRAGYIEHNPLDRVKCPRLHKQQRNIITEQQAVALIKDLRSLPDKDHCFVLAILLALLCTLRLGEVCAIRYADVDWQAGTIDISKSLKYTSKTGAFIDRPKTDSANRIITLPPSMMDLLQWGWELDYTDRAIISLEDEQAKRPPRYCPVGYIVHGRMGKPMNKDTPSKWFHRFALAHGLDITFHDLRHVHASILVAHGVDIAAVASRMGHSDASVTLSTYTHPYASQDKRAAEVLDSLLAQSAPFPADPAQDPAQDPATSSTADPADGSTAE